MFMKYKAPWGIQTLDKTIKNVCRVGRFLLERFDKER